MRVGDLHVSQALHAMWGNSGTKTISLPTKSHVVMRLMPTTKTEITIGGGLQFSSNGNNTHANAVPAPCPTTLPLRREKYDPHYYYVLR